MTQHAHLLNYAVTNTINSSPLLIPLYPSGRFAGKVTDGSKVVKAIEAVGSSSGKTSQPITIKDCGELK